MKIKFISANLPSWAKTFVMFFLSTVVSVIGDAVLQVVTTGGWDFSSIHWKDIAGAIAVAVITYAKKEFLTEKNAPIS